MRTLPLLLLVFTSACGDPPWVGTFDSSATWNVSGPLADGRTVGDAIADLLIGALVSYAPVPGPLEGSVHELADELVRADVKALIDTSVPAALGPTGVVTNALRSTLASVAVASTIVLEEATFDDMEGVETLKTVSVTIDGVQHDLAPADLLGKSGKLQAEWGGDEDDKGLEVEPHGVPLHFGRIVLYVAEQVVDAAELTALENAVTALFDCGGLVGSILDGASGLTLSVSSWSHTIPAADFVDLCEDVKSLGGDRALGIFAMDAAVTLGGKITVKDAAHPTLTSRAGFGGTVNVAPEVIAPRLVVQLSARRR